MKVFTSAMIDAALEPAATMAAMGAAFRGGLYAPARHHHAIPRDAQTATLLIMPAWTEQGAAQSYCGIKLVSVYPENATRGLASVQGSYILNDGDTGVPLAVMDGARLTLHRTAATSAFASSCLARRDATRLTLLGAGALAPFLVRAHVAARPSIRQVSIWNRNEQRAVDVAGQLSFDPTLAKVRIEAATDLESSLRGADIVSCATLSTTPLIRGAWLKPGAHLDLVGAFNLAMREADDDALTRAEVFIDTPACLTEGGDVAVAIKAGVLAQQDVRGDLFALARGAHPGRRNDTQVTLFKSIGAAIEDLAAAILVWTRGR